MPRPASSAPAWRTRTKRQRQRRRLGVWVGLGHKRRPQAALILISAANYGVPHGLPHRRTRVPCHLRFRVPTWGEEENVVLGD